MAKSFKGVAGKFSGFFAEFPKDKIRICASSFAYYCFISVIPLLSLCISLISHIGASQDEVATFTRSTLPSSLNELAAAMVGEAYLYSNVFISINTVILILFASSGVWSLYNGLNEAFGLEDTQNKTTSFLKSLLYTVVAGVGLAFIMFLSLKMTVFEVYMNTTTGLDVESWYVYAVNVLLGIIITTLAVAACYAYLPVGRRSFRKQLPSAFLAVIICNLLWYLIDFLMNLISSPDMLIDDLASAILFLY
ncbi:MAG: YhjD/YihY/BrkB family envelope integrity protein, partial [Coriobacteriales bacterium]|nr:YhjD/YihY/BrkB family envelope integrity protein [Coriobacteriales bacterium]